MAAIMVLVVVLWVTEALPMAVVAMLGPLLAVLMGVAKARAAFASFADPIIFLFIGSFMLAEAMFVHGVDRRIAYTALSWRAVGTSGPRILAVYGGVATVLSMWISNTATTAMMFPIGMSIVAHMAKTSRKGAGDMRRFAMAMMLITAFGASVGGMGTPVGTPPNLIGIGLIERIHGVHIDFFAWMALGVPLVVLLFAFLVAYFYLTCAKGVRAGEGSAALVRDELRKLGPVSAGQRNVLFAFAVTVLLWVLPGLLAAAGLGELAVREGLRGGRAGVGRGDGRRHPPVPAARQLARPPVHADVGRGRAHRLGHRPAVRRRAGARRPRLQHGAGEGHGRRAHGLAAVADAVHADRDVHGPGESSSRRPRRTRRRRT